MPSYQKSLSNVEVHFLASPSCKSFMKLAGFSRQCGGEGGWRASPDMASEHYSVTYTWLGTSAITDESTAWHNWGNWSPVILEETQLSQRKSWHLSFTAKDIGKEILGGGCLYPGSDSFSSILCSSQDQSMLQNSWRRKIQPSLGATMVRHHSNRLSRKSVESCYNNVQHIFMGQRRCRLYCKKD